MAEALLNPPQESEASKAIIKVAKNRLVALNDILCNSVLEERNYLQAIGAAKEIKKLVAEMEREYQRQFGV